MCHQEALFVGTALVQLGAHQKVQAQRREGQEITLKLLLAYLGGKLSDLQGSGDTVPRTWLTP